MIISNHDIVQTLSIVFIIILSYALMRYKLEGDSPLFAFWNLGVDANGDLVCDDNENQCEHGMFSNMMKKNRAIMKKTRKKLKKIHA
jgi:hypothetical protein